MSPAPYASRAMCGALAVPVGRWECDLESERLRWSNEVYNIFGLPRGGDVDRGSSLSLYESESRARLSRLRAGAIQSSGCFTLEARIHGLDGCDRWMRLIATVDQDARGRPRLHGLKQDITVERQSWDTRRRLADHDPLTGLAANGLFHDVLHRRIRDSGPIAGVILIRITTIAEPPDPAAGREMLRHSARRLQRLFPMARLLARTGPRTFAVMLRTAPAAPMLETTLRRARMALRRPIPWQEGWLSPDVSLGAAMGRPTTQHDPAALLDDAATALRDARCDGAGGVAIFGTRIPEPESDWLL